MTDGAGSVLTVSASYDELPGLLPAVRSACRPGRCVVVELGPPGRVDVRVLGALAALALTARRCCGRVEVHGRDPDLRSLAELLGLAEVLELHNGGGAG